MPGGEWTSILVAIGIILVSLSVHESAHAWMASQLGDPTARLLGRISLNPARHIDPFGTLLLPALIAFSTQGRASFGYAKPVPFNPYALKNPALGSAAIAAAGPVSNFLLAAVCALVLGLASPGGDLHASLGHYLLRRFVELNVFLGLFNLVPVPPLDGGTVLVGLLPRGAARAWARVEPLAPILFIVLLVSGVIQRFLSPVAYTVTLALFDFARGLRG